MCYFRIFGVEITIFGAKLYTKSCYFRTIGVEIAHFDAEIALPKTFGVNDIYVLNEQIIQFPMVSFFYVINLQCCSVSMDF